MKNPVSFLRTITMIEAVSFLVLLGIAMPLKYVWHMPMAVRIAGSIHGGLFLAFCFALWRSWRDAKWPTQRAAMVFIVSFLPVVPFFIDHRLREWVDEFEKSRGSA